jgi:oligoendopeptidase F
MNSPAWIGKRLVFEDPLYNVNYLFAMLVTCKLYELHLSDPGAFARNYDILLKNGFSDTAKTQLKKYMHIDLNNDELLSAAAMLFKEKLTLIVFK